MTTKSKSQSQMKSKSQNKTEFYSEFRSFALPSIKESDSKYVQLDSSLFEKKIKNLKVRLVEKDSEISSLSKQVETLKIQLDSYQYKLAQKTKELDLEAVKDGFYKDLISLNTTVDQLKAIKGYSDKITSSKSIAEDIDQLTSAQTEDLLRMRDTLQAILKLERKLADSLLEVKYKAKDGFYNISAEDMSSRWNQDMNTFVAVLFELTKRHYVDQLNEANLMRIKYQQQQSEISRFKNIHKKTSEMQKSDEKVIQDLKKQVDDFKRGKSHIYEEVNHILKDQYDYKLKRTKYEFDKLSDSEQKLVAKLKSALKEDNKTIVKLSNSIVTLYNKYQDFQTEIKTLRDEIDTKNDQLTKLYSYFKNEKQVLDKNQESEKAKLLKDIDELRVEEKAKDKKIEELFLENKTISTTEQTIKEENNTIASKLSAITEKSKDYEKKYLELMEESKSERSTYMDKLSKVSKEKSDMSAKLEELRKEKEFLDKMNSKLKEERKNFMAKGIPVRENEDDNRINDIGNKLNSLEDNVNDARESVKSNNSDFYSVSGKPNVKAVLSNNSEKRAMPRFNQVDKDTEIYDTDKTEKDYDYQNNPYANWKDAVQKMRFKEQQKNNRRNKNYKKYLKKEKEDDDNSDIKLEDQ